MRERVRLTRDVTPVLPNGRTLGSIPARTEGIARRYKPWGTVGVQIPGRVGIDRIPADALEVLEEEEDGDCPECDGEGYTTVRDYHSSDGLRVVPCRACEKPPTDPVDRAMLNYPEEC